MRPQVGTARKPHEFPHWVRLGRADHLSSARMCGRSYPVTGPIQGGRIGAALGQNRLSGRSKKRFDHERAATYSYSARRGHAKTSSLLLGMNR